MRLTFWLSLIEETVVNIGNCVIHQTFLKIKKFKILLPKHLWLEFLPNLEVFEDKFDSKE